LSPELLFELAIVIAGKVAVGIARIALVKLLVGIVDDRGASVL
jgi:hypothetical protein